MAPPKVVTLYNSIKTAAGGPAPTLRAAQNARKLMGGHLERQPQAAAGESQGTQASIAKRYRDNSIFCVLDVDRQYGQPQALVSECTEGAWSSIEPGSPSHPWCKGHIWWAHVCARRYRERMAKYSNTQRIFSYSQTCLALWLLCQCTSLATLEAALARASGGSEH